jgi:hemerythrin-like domain-containing protein
VSQDAIALLKADHDKVRDLLKKLSETTSRGRKTRQELLEKIATELSIHTTLEEEIFYPAFKGANGKSHQVMYFEAREEHRAVEALVLPDLQKTEPDSECFSGRAKVLKELVEHHAQEEEEEMFPQARKTLSAKELQELGVRMADRKRELQKG